MLVDTISSTFAASFALRDTKPIKPNRPTPRVQRAPDVIVKGRSMNPLESRRRPLSRCVLLAIAMVACWAALWPVKGVFAQVSKPHTIAVRIPTPQPPEALAATEVRGLLPHPNDRHYFGLEATHPGAVMAVTLIAESADAVRLGDDVNFVVLTEQGLSRFLAGEDPLSVKHAAGSPLLFDQVGNRLTALVPGSPVGPGAGGYTIIVYNNGTIPVAYTLQVEGGVLRDDARQTFATVQVAAAVDVTVDNREGIVKRLAVAPALAGALPQAPVQLPVAPLRARRVSGALGPLQDRHYLNLTSEGDGGEIVLTLRMREGQSASDGANFWVMTQDGVRHLVQGGLAQELNLAIGRLVSESGESTVYEARLRAAPNVVYTVVVFNDGPEIAAYSLSVQGGVLIDPYGQTNEARAAALEVIALAAR